MSLFVRLGLENIHRIINCAADDGDKNYRCDCNVSPELSRYQYIYVV